MAPHLSDKARHTADAAPNLEGGARLGHDFGATRVRRGDPPRPQAKLVVGSPGDIYEQEADRVAAQVVNMPEAPEVAREAAGARAAAPHSVQRACAACESREDDDDERAVQAKSQNGSAPAVTEEFGAGLRAARGGGQPLPESARAYFEPRFGHDFSRVRVHTGEAAEGLARSVEARAFTTGSDIFFGARQYDSTSRAGRELLAHELTHVLQQSPAGGGGEARPSTLSRRPAETIARQPAPAAESRPAAEPASNQPPSPETATGRVNLIRITPAEVILETTVGTFSYALDFNHTPAGDYTADVRMKETQTEAGVSYSARLVLRGQVKTEAPLYTNAEGFTEFFHFSYRIAAGQPDPALFLKNTSVVSISVAGTKAPGAAGGVEGGTDAPAGGGEVKGEGEGATPEGAGGEKEGGGQKPEGAKQGDRTSFGGGLEGETGLPANAPQLPSRLEGPGEQPVGGTGTYTMRLDYSPAGADMLRQLVEAMNAVEYHWELYDITAAAKKSGEEADAELKRVRRKGQLAEDAEGARSVGTTEAASRRFEVTADEMAEDRLTAREDLQEALNEKDVIRALVSLGNLDPNVAAVSGIVRISGDALGFVADAIGGDYQERSVPWEKEGVYVLRCVARPRPRFFDNGESIVRPPSVAVTTIAVKSLGEMGADEIRTLQTQDEELNLLRGLLERETDPAQREKLEGQIAEYEKATRGAAPDVLQEAIDKKKAQLDLEERRGNVYPARRLRREIESLEQQLELARTRVEARAGQSVLRPRATFISRITGQKYPLLLQLQLTEPGAAGGKHRARVADVTTPDGIITDAAEADTPGEAAWRALRLFSRRNEYGRGTLAVVLPEGISPAPSQTTDQLDNKPHDIKIAKRHLEDIVTALSVVSMVAVPELGAVAALAGAGLAAANLAERYKHGTLRLDAGAVGDLVAVLSAAALGVGAVGGLAFARSGNKFVLALAEGNEAAVVAAARGMNRAQAVVRGASAAGELMNYGGMVVGAVTTLDQLLYINGEEAAGRMSHAEARYQRTKLVAAAVRDNALMIVGAATHARAGEAAGEGGGTRPAAGEPPAMTPSKTTAEPSAETGAAGGGGAAEGRTVAPADLEAAKRGAGAGAQPPATVEPAGTETAGPALPKTAEPAQEPAAQALRQEQPAGEPAPPAAADRKPDAAPDALAAPARPEVAAEMGQLGRMDAETRKRLEGDDALRKALVENDLAAAVLKKCQSPCFPPEATPAQVERLNNILKRMKSGGVAYDQVLLKQFLADNRAHLDEAITSLMGWESTEKLNAALRYFAEGGEITYGLDPKLLHGMRQRAHDVGVDGGRNKAAGDGLKSFGWDNPIKTGGFGQGFDDIMFKGGDLDTGHVYIVEYKGGRAKLAEGQMELAWVVENIRRLATYGGANGHDTAVKLAKALREGRLKGVVYSTPLVGDKPQPTVQVGGIRDYGPKKIILPAPPGM